MGTVGSLLAFCFIKDDPLMGRVSITWGFVRNEDSCAPSKTHWSETHREGPENRVLAECLGDCDAVVWEPLILRCLRLFLLWDTVSSVHMPHDHKLLKDRGGHLLFLLVTYQGLQSWHLLLQQEEATSVIPGTISKDLESYLYTAETDIPSIPFYFLTFLSLPWGSRISQIWSYSFWRESWKSGGGTVLRKFRSKWKVSTLLTLGLDLHVIKLFSTFTYFLEGTHVMKL